MSAGDGDSRASSAAIKAREEQLFLMQKLFIAITQLHQSLDADRVYRTTFEILRDFVGACRSALVLQRDDGTRHVVLEKSPGAPEMPEEHQERLSELPNLSRVISTRNSWMFRGLATEIPSEKPADLEPWEPLVIYPLLVQRRCVGVICIFEFVARRARLEQIDFQFFTLLSEHAGSAIVSAELYGKAEAELSTLKGIREAAMQNLELDKSARAALEHVRRALPADAHHFFAPSQDGDELVLLATTGDAEVGLRVPIEGTLLGRLFETGDEPVQIVGSREETSDSAYGLFTACALACNVVHGENRHAMLLLTRDDEREIFGSELRDLLRSACTQMAVGIQNAVYFEALQTQRDQLDVARARAEEASRFKSEFLANMSHEIRTPMNAIIGFADLLHEDEQDPAKRKKIGIVRNAGAHLLSILNDILDLSKIEAGKVTIHPEPFALHRSIEQVQSICVVRAEQKDIGLRALVEVGTPRVVFGDEQRIRQVLLNLVGNAIKFTQEGEVTIECGWSDGEARIVVRDTGIGMSPEQLERIFESFEQAEGSTTRKFGGTGLGLTISRKLVELMGGEILVESEQGRGSTFTVRIALPRAKPTPDLIASAREYVLRGRDRRVGYVEDDPASAAILRELLTRNGFLAIPFELGDDFVDRVAEERIELLILDVLVCGENALTYNDALKQDPRTASLPVVVCSVEDEGTFRGNYGYVDFIRKPFSQASFVRRVHAALRQQPGGGRVMVVDPSDGAEQSYESLLTAATEIRFARSVSEALGALDEFAPELVVMDSSSLLVGAVGTREGALLREELARRAVAVVVLSAHATGGGGVSEVVLPPELHDVDDVLELLTQRLDRGDVEGEQMVQRWLSAQRLPKLRELVLDNIRNRLFAEIGQLEVAIVTGDVEGVRRFAHAIKSWSGSYKMTEIYSIVRRIDAAAAEDPVDLAQLRLDAFELGEVLGRIPASYLRSGEDANPRRRHVSGLPPAPVEARALIVDDNEMNRLLLSTLMTRRGVACDMATNGREALEQMSRNSYDVVWLDMEMPVMDGWTAIARIREDPALEDTYVVALTAHVLARAAERCIEAGCDDYLAKPLDITVFYEKLEARLRLHPGAPPAPEEKDEVASS